MSGKAYLEQVPRADRVINLNLSALYELEQSMYGVSTPSLEQNYNATRNTEAPFARKVALYIDRREEINRQIDRLVDLKTQAESAIKTMADIDERSVLWHRYIQGKTLREISSVMGVSLSTVKRWYSSGLDHFVLPENPIKI